MKDQKKHPWNTEDWFVSPWNFLEEVTKDFHPPKEVKINDTTLRDGEQQAGIVFKKDERIRIAEKLAEAGVQRIEAGWTEISPYDVEAIEEIVKRDLGPEIFCGCRSIVDEVKRVADCGVDGILIGIPCAPHLIEHAYHWTLAKAIDSSVKATQCAKEHGLYTVWFPMDSTRSDLHWLLGFLDEVSKEGHMDAMVLADTFGVLSPQAASYYARSVKKRARKPLEVHFHNNFGLAMANTLMTVLAGAEVVHASVSGIGEGAGNCPTEEIAVALWVLYGIDVGIKYQHLTELFNLVEHIAGTRACKPLVGDGVNDIESGGVTHWYKSCFSQHPTEIFPLLPQFVGHRPPEIRMGKKSGIDNIQIWADQLGMELTPEEMRKVLSHVKQRSYDLKRLLTKEEFAEIVNRVKGS